MTGNPLRMIARVNLGEMNKFQLSCDPNCFPKLRWHTSILHRTTPYYGKIDQANVSAQIVWGDIIFAIACNAGY